MAITVYGIEPAAGGFGMYERAGDGVVLEQYDSAEEYAHEATVRNGWHSYSVDADEAAMGDEDGERLAAGIRERDGKIYDQNGGIVVGFCRTNEPGEEHYELVIEER